MLTQPRREVSLDEKLRYLREVENIHRLSKKVLPPQGTTWARIADKHLQRALGMPLQGERTAFDVRRGRHMHQHSPRTARVVERTLRNGVIHPDALHSYRNDGITKGKARQFRQRIAPKQYDQDVIHYVQHGSTDLEYPHGHLQGFGFVPRQHEINSHVKLKTGPTEIGVQVPSKDGQAAGSHYH